MGAKDREFLRRVLLFADLPPEHLERITKSLLLLAERHGSSTPMGIRIELHLTHQELANLVGASRETVTRTLGEFQEEGYVAVEGRRLVLTDWQALRRLA